MSNDRLTDEEIADYGEEFLQVVGKKAKEIAAPQLNYLHQKLADVENKLAHTARDDMKDALDKAVPMWREINERPEFITALELKDDYTGVKFIDLLTRAWRANDVTTVRNYFEKAAIDMGYMPRPPQPQPAPRDNRPIQNGPRGYYRSNDPAGGRTMTRAQVAQAYDNYNRGRYKGREAEWQALERDIVELGRLGRIIG
jgi:hypothetical protein